MYSVNKTSHRGLQQQPSSHKKSSSGARKAEVEERTRDRVLRGVLNHGPVSAASLGELLSLTPAAVRRHLDANNMGQVQGAQLDGTSSHLKVTNV